MTDQNPLLLPGDGSPAAAAMARAQAPAPQPTPPPAAPTGPIVEPAGTSDALTFRRPDGTSHLIPQTELPSILEEHARFKAQIPQLEQEAQATRDLLGLVGQDQRRMQQLQALLDNWQTGRSIPPETFGFVPKAPAMQPPAFGAPRSGLGGSFFDDDPAPAAPAPAPPSAELEELRATLSQVTRELQAMRSQTQAQTEAQKAEARRLDITTRFGAYSFLKENPRAMELALRQAEFLGTRDPRLGTDLIVRQVAQEMQDLLGAQAARMASHARSGMPAPIGSSEGIPFAASTEPPMTASELQSGRGVDRIMKRLQTFAANRAVGTQQS